MAVDYSFCLTTVFDLLLLFISIPIFLVCPEVVFSLFLHMDIGYLACRGHQTMNQRRVGRKDHYGLEDVKERILEHIAVSFLKAQRQPAYGPKASFGRWCSLCLKMFEVEKASACRIPPRARSCAKASALASFLTSVKFLPQPVQ